MSIIIINSIIIIIYYITILPINNNKNIISILIIITYYIIRNIPNSKVSWEIKTIEGILIVSIVGIIQTNDLIKIYLWIEIYTISTYILLYSSKNKQIKQKGILYYIIGSISSSIIILGIYIIYKNKGTIWYEEISLIKTKEIGKIIIVIGLIIKLGIFPFQNYIIKIYPWYNKRTYNIIITIPQIAIIYTINKNMEYMGTNIKYIILSTIIVGTIIGTRYKNYKNIIIGSSILNIGYIGLIISIIIKEKNMETSISIKKVIILYLIIYTITNTLIITIINTTPKIYKKDRINIIIGIISIIGIPPLMGFIGKINIIKYIIKNITYKESIIYISIIIISTTISIIYYLVLVSPYLYGGISERIERKEIINIIKSIYTIIITYIYIIIPYINPYIEYISINKD